MNWTTLIASDLRQESELTRRALENVPPGMSDWKPDPKSMPFGRLAHLVATMPSWFSMMVNMDELDVQPASGSNYKDEVRSAQDLVEALEKTTKEAIEAVSGTSDAHLEKPWKLLAAGEVKVEKPRNLFMFETLKHWAHHRGQLTVYLRMTGAEVPAIYGPSADDNRFE